jgi:hypothetical protein
MRELFLVRVASVLIALLAAGFITFPSFPNGIFVADSPLAVNRALKGDRLLSISPAVFPRELGSPLVPHLPAQSTPRKKIPVGCDASFSPISSPLLANVFGRCVA